MSKKAMPRIEVYDDHDVSADTQDAPTDPLRDRERLFHVIGHKTERMDHWSEPGPMISKLNYLHKEGQVDTPHYERTLLYLERAMHETSRLNPKTLDRLHNQLHALHEATGDFRYITIIQQSQPEKHARGHKPLRSARVQKRLAEESIDEHFNGSDSPYTGDDTSISYMPPSPEESIVKPEPDYQPVKVDEISELFNEETHRVGPNVFTREAAKVLNNGEGEINRLGIQQTSSAGIPPRVDVCIKGNYHNEGIIPGSATKDNVEVGTWMTEEMKRRAEVINDAPNLEKFLRMQERRKRMDDGYPV